MQLETRIERFARELGLEARFFQSNHEGEYVEEIHKAGDYADGLLLNPGAWTHYAVAARRRRVRGLPAVEVHLSDVESRGVPARVGVRRRGEGAGPWRRRLPRRTGGAQGGAVSRADRVADLLAERSLDLLLVTNLVNVRYLTGYTGSNGIAIVGRDLRRFITDFRYVEQAAVEVEGFDREQASQDLVSGLAEGGRTAS